MAHIAGMYRPQSDTVYMETVYPVLSMFSLLFLHFFLYGCNIFAWRKTRINYSFIFELSPTKDLKYRDVFLICTMSMTAVVGVLFIHISLMAKGYSYTQIQVIPGLLLMISLLLLVCPLNIVYRSSRYHLLRVLRNIVLSPLYKVVMLDFFMADQLCSQVPMLRNLEYVTCYYITGSYKTQDYGYCMRTKNYRDLAYAVSFLLYYWRAMQCARRWFDEGETSHLINLGKYVSAMLAAGAKVAYEKERTIGWLCLFRSQWTPRSRKSYTREEFDDVRLEALGYIQRFVEGYVRRREYDLADDMFWEAGNVCANEELQALLLDKHRQLDVYSKALKFFKAQKFARALDKIEVLGAAVNFPVLWVLKLRCLLKLNRAKDADEIKSKIVDISAKNVTVLFDLGKSYMEEGDYVSALEVYAKGVDSAQDQKIKFSFTEECEKAQHMKNKDGGPV